MTGIVTADREAVVWIKIRGTNGLEADLEAVLDTRFSEYFTLPQTWIDALALPQLIEDNLVLDDGSNVQSEVYDGLISWEGHFLAVPIHRLEENPLIGMALLWDHLLTVHVRDGGDVTIDPLP